MAARVAREGLPWFLAWSAVGIVAGTGAVALLTIGLALLVVGALAAVVLLRTAGASRACWGLVAGLGGAPLLLAWLNRGGPGTVCSDSGSGQSCLDEWSPWPFLAVGAVLVLAGVVGYLASTWRSAPSSSGYTNS